MLTVRLIDASVKVAGATPLLSAARLFISSITSSAAVLLGPCEPVANGGALAAETNAKLKGVGAELEAAGEPKMKAGEGAGRGLSPCAS